MRIKRIFFSLILSAVLLCSVGTGCGSSSSSDSAMEDGTITSDEGAWVTHDDNMIIDTENSDIRCDASGDDCYSFATRYSKVGSQTSVGIIDSSGHRFFFEFVSSLSDNTLYKYVPGASFTSQDLRMYVTYNSPGISCSDACSNVYNYSDLISCNSDEETCKYYIVSVNENSDDFLDFEFEIWNRYFLEESPDYPEAERSAIFKGHIKVKKEFHNGSEDYFYPEDD